MAEACCRRARQPAEPGPLTAISLANTIAASLPEHAIVVDEANTSGFALPRPWPARRGTPC